MSPSLNWCRIYGFARSVWASPDVVASCTLLVERSFCCLKEGGAVERMLVCNGELRVTSEMEKRKASCMLVRLAEKNKIN